MLSAGQLARLALAAFRAWRADRASSMGAALAFYTLFSMAPLLLLAIAVAGLFVGRTDAEMMLMDQIGRVMGEDAAGTVKALLEAAGRNNGKYPAIVGAGMLLFGAATVFRELRSDLDVVWKSTRGKAKGAWGFLRDRLLSFGMVLAIGFLLLVSLIASTLLTAIGGLWFDSTALLRGGEFALSFLVVTGLFAMIYKLLPSTKIAWSDVWVGAAATSLLFWVGKYLIGLYLGKSAMASSFGAAGTLVVVIAWVYYSAQIFLLGAEFTREYANVHGSLRDRVAAGPQAANEPNILERAQSIVSGNDPVLLRRTPSP
jgi:membrane protein